MGQFFVLSKKFYAVLLIEQNIYNNLSFLLVVVDLQRCPRKIENCIFFNEIIKKTRCFFLISKQANKCFVPTIKMLFYLLIICKRANVNNGLKRKMNGRQVNDLSLLKKASNSEHKQLAGLQIFGLVLNIAFLNTSSNTNSCLGISKNKNPIGFFTEILLLSGIKINEKTKF